jgi:hypothetical protein
MLKQRLILGQLEDIRIGGLRLDIISYVLFQYSNYFLCNVLSDFLCSLYFRCLGLCFLCNNKFLS